MVNPVMENISNFRDRIEEIRADSGQLQTTALPSNTDSEHDEETDQDEADENNVEAQEIRRLRQSIAQRKKLATPSPPNNVLSGIAGASDRQYKKNTSCGSVEDSVYSTLSNEMYSKIAASPGPGGGSTNVTWPVTPPPPPALAAAATNHRSGKRRSREELRHRLRELALTSETGSASVIEVIEPTSSEEDEFKRSIWHEMNVKWAASAAPAAAADEDEATRPRRQETAAAAAVTTEGATYAANELSPTKRLLEMGISPSTLEDRKAEDNIEGGGGVTTNGRQLPGRQTPLQLVPSCSFGAVAAEANAQEAHDVDKKTAGFFKKIASWNKRRGERKEPAGKEGDHSLGNGDDDDVLGDAEEHVLPDSFEDDIALSVLEEHAKEKPKVEFRLKPVAMARTTGNVIEGSRSSSSSGNKSLSPQSRKSLNGSKSTMASEDSGIFIAKSLTEAPVALPSGLNKMKEPSRNNNALSKEDDGTEPAGPGRQHRTVLRMNNNATAAHNLKNVDENPVTLLRKKSLESKAWYDVPSDDERAGGVGEQEVDDEADESLASIISTGRPSSDED